MHGVEKLATGLYNAGVREGDVIAFFAGNDCAVEWTLLLWAAWRLGAVFTPLEPRLLNHVSEFEEMRGLMKPAVVFAEKVPGSGVLGTSSCEKIVKLVAGTHSARGWSTLEGIATPSSSSIPPPLPESQALQRGLIMFTSGTTTTPRGCPLSYGNLFAEVTGYRGFAGSNWTASAKFLVTTSVFRPICYLGSCLSWTAGGSVVFDRPQFDPSSTIAAINREAVTHLIVVPTQLYAVVQELKRSDLSIQSQLTFVTAAGDVTAPELLADAQQLLGSKRLVTHWGSSEGAPVLGYTKQANAALPKLPSGDTAVGYPLPGSSVKVCSPGETDNPIILPRGERGEMHVSSPSMIKNYLEGQSSSTFYEDATGLRWWRTGDWAVMNEQGAIFIVGRLKDIIKCRGIGLYPLVMERWIQRKFGIQATIVGVPHPDYGEKPVAVVSSLQATAPEQSLDHPINGSVKSSDDTDSQDSHVVSREEIIRSMSSELGPDFILGEVYTLEEIGLSSWPLNSFAKLHKRVLRDLVERKHSGVGAQSASNAPMSEFLRRAHGLTGSAEAASLYDEYSWHMMHSTKVAMLLLGAAFRPWPIFSTPPAQRLPPAKKNCSKSLTLAAALG